VLRRKRKVTTTTTGMEEAPAGGSTSLKPETCSLIRARN